MKWLPLTPPASLVGEEDEEVTRRHGAGPREVGRRPGSSRPCPSCRPRPPQRHPSRSTPAKGSTCQSAASAGTTSRCPGHRPGRVGSAPAIRTTTVCRPGSDSVDVRFEAHFPQFPHDVCRGLRLPGAGPVTRVAGVDPEQVTAEVHDLVPGCDRGGLAHADPLWRGRGAPRADFSGGPACIVSRRARPLPAVVSTRPGGGIGRRAGFEVLVPV